MLNKKRARLKDAIVVRKCGGFLPLLPRFHCCRSPAPCVGLRFNGGYNRWGYNSNIFRIQLE